MYDASTQRDVFQKPELCRVWAETIGRAEGALPAVCLATNDDGHRVLLLWTVQGAGGPAWKRRGIQPLGGSHFCYQNPLSDASADRIDWPSLWNAARREVAGLADQGLIRFVHPLFAAGVPSEHCSEQNPILSLGGVGDFDGLLARCSGNHRGDARRRLRRMRELGDLQLWTPAAEEHDAALEEFDQRMRPAYSESWSARPEGDMLERPGAADFLRRSLSQGIMEGWAHFAVLRSNGRSVAWHLGLLSDNELYWWVPNHLAEFNAYSPGKVLLSLLLEHAIAKKWRCVHFLTGGHAYKLAWKPDPLDLRAVRWHSPSLRGRLFALYDRLRAPPPAAAAGQADDHAD